MKRWELKELKRKGGKYRVTVYNTLGRYIKEVTIEASDRPSLIHKLRKEYDCVVGRRFER